MSLIPNTYARKWHVAFGVVFQLTAVFRLKGEGEKAFWFRGGDAHAATAAGARFWQFLFAR
jgi:hypothetical protein